MLDQNEFMETLHAVDELAAVSEKALSKKEILEAFSDLELSEEQQNLIVDYFRKKRQERKRAENKQQQKEDHAVSELKYTSEQQKKAEKKFLEAPFVKMYLDDIAAVEVMSEEMLLDALQSLHAGNKNARKKVAAQYLQEVISIAKRYVMLKVRMEDVIQEGNMGLMLALDELEVGMELAEVDAFLKNAIQTSMEQFIDSQLENENWENAVLGRANLLGAAKEALAKDLMRVPTTKELSDYTHLSEQEIEDIWSLVKEKTTK